MARMAFGLKSALREEELPAEVGVVWAGRLGVDDDHRDQEGAHAHDEHEDVEEVEGVREGQHFQRWYKYSTEKYQGTVAPEAYIGAIR